MELACFYAKVKLKEKEKAIDSQQVLEEYKQAKIVRLDILNKLDSEIKKIKKMKI